MKLCDYFLKLYVVKVSSLNYFLSFNIDRICDNVNSFVPISHLQKIFIGEPIKEIEDEAFFYLEFIKEVYLPPTIKRIGIRSFMNCRMLNYISIPDSVKIIEEQAFCLTDLKSVLVSKKTIIKERAFPSGCQINYRD